MGQIVFLHARSKVRAIALGLAMALASGLCPENVSAQQNSYSRSPQQVPANSAAQRVSTNSYRAGQSTRTRGTTNNVTTAPPTGQRAPSSRRSLNSPQRRQPPASTQHRYQLGPHQVQAPASTPPRPLPISVSTSSTPIPAASKSPRAASNTVATASHEAPATVKREDTIASADYRQPVMPEPPDFRNLILRLLCGTAIVLIACVGSLLLGKRWLQKGTLNAMNSGQLKQLDSVGLPNRGCLQLFEVDGQRILVGLDATGLKSVLPLANPFSDALAAAEQNSETNPMRQGDENSETRATLVDLNEVMEWNHRRPTQSGL